MLGYIKKNLELFLLPILFLVIFLSVQYGWRYLGLPTENQLILKIQTFFNTYGLWVIFLSSVLESMLFIGWYFPGSLVIFLGVASTQGDPMRALWTILAVCTGMLIGYTINYFLGKYGWHKVLLKFGFGDELQKIQKRVDNKGLMGAFFLYIMPGAGCLLSTAFGVLKFDFLKFFFFTLLMVVFWNTLWGVIVYHFGMSVFKLLTNGIFAFLVFSGYVYYLHTQGKLKAKT
jgi:membrane protein DedA with SNARE-associated domain